MKRKRQTHRPARIKTACRRLAEDIGARRERALLAGGGPPSAGAITAGGLPRCPRQGYYNVALKHRKPPLSPDEAARMEKGRKEKLLALAELVELGFELTRAHIPFSFAAQKRYGIRGRLDAGVKLRTPRRTLEVPLAVKSIHPLAFAAVRTALDLKKHPLYCSYYRQAQACIQAFETNALLLLLSDCLGHWKLLAVSRDKEELRDIRACVRAINAALRGGPLPQGRPAKKACARCHFAPQCEADARA